jgi:hypothetical protein
MQLGKCSTHLGPDNTSAATHELEQMPGRPRAYDSDYLELCTHYNLTPLTINIACPHGVVLQMDQAELAH